MGIEDKKILDKFDDLVSSSIDNGLVVNGDLHKRISEIRDYILIQHIDGDYPKLIRILYKMGRQLHGYIAIFGGMYLATHGVAITTELAILMAGPSSLYIWAKGKGASQTT